MNALVCASFLTLILAGCGSFKPLPSAPPEPVQVMVPVPVPCVETMPDRPKKCVAKDKTHVEMLRCVLVDKILNDAYAAELESVLTACTKL